MVARGTCRGLGLLGVAGVLAACAWWAALFPAVVANTGLSLGQAIPCLASSSDVCALEASLCGGRHLLGIRHYSPTLFWLGTGLLSASLLAGSVLPERHR